MSTNIFGFENLAAYQRAMDLVDKVYDLLKGFPAEERYALCDQLRRAVVSVPSNIAEGLGRTSSKEQVHFLEISYGSLMETYCQLSIAKRRHYISDEVFKELASDIENIVRPLSGLRNSLHPQP
jgi:four helix bundle protein